MYVVRLTNWHTYPWTKNIFGHPRFINTVKTVTSGLIDHKAAIEVEITFCRPLIPPTNTMNKVENISLINLN